jgi:hypothetical protein
VGSTAILLRPSLGPVLFPIVVLAAFIGEGTLALWLTTKGLDTARWSPDGHPHARLLSSV